VRNLALNAPGSFGRPAPGPLYAIADKRALGTTPIPEAVKQFADAGIRWIQIRSKGALSDAELYRVIEASCRAVEGTEAALWIDDRADLAALFPVAGLHLGQRDLPPAAARRIVGRETWIGCSTHTAAELEAADHDPEVDVIAFGPIFPTASKRDAEPAVGLELLRFARRATQKTLVAIGGIGPSNLAEVLATGADSAVVLSAACTGEIATNLARLARAIEAIAPSTRPRSRPET
jgi:thiamine-phosphate pyrophosphorylase